MLKLTKRTIIAFLPMLLWIAVIAMFSGDAFSARKTGGWLEWLVTVFHGKVTPQKMEALHFMVRKLAHFFTYAVLSLLAFRAWRNVSEDPRQWRLKWAVLALAVALVVASADEYHQGFTRSRGPSVVDVGIDMMGATFTQLLIAVVMLPRRRIAHA